MVDFPALVYPTRQNSLILLCNRFLRCVCRCCSSCLSSLRSVAIRCLICCVSFSFAVSFAAPWHLGLFCFDGWDSFFLNGLITKPFLTKPLLRPVSYSLELGKTFNPLPGESNYVNQTCFQMWQLQQRNL